MPQISMTMLNVHKVKAQLPRHFSCTVKILDDCFNFRVFKKRIIARQAQPAIQYRMVIKNAWLRPVVRIRAAVPPGMGQLQANEKPVLRARCLLMFFAENSSRPCQALASVGCNHKLLRIGAAFVRNRDRFSSPD